MDIEDRMRGYRPAGPPARLRARVLDARRRATAPGPVVLWWLPALAAAAATVLFALLAGRARADIEQRAAGAGAARAEAVRTLTADFGGTAVARIEAEHVVSESDTSSPSQTGEGVTVTREGEHRD